MTCTKIKGVITQARALAVLVLMALAVFGLGGSPTYADSPLDVRGEITDNAGVLSPSDEAEVQQALDDYHKKTGFQLFVVYVKSFNGLSGAEWSDQTATKSGLGTTETLLAVAVDDRKYGTSVPNEHPISDDDFAKIETEQIEPALRNDDWAGAAIAAAEGYSAAAENSGLPWGPILFGGAIVAGGGALVVRRIRRKYDNTHVVLDEHGQPIDPLSQLSTEELNKKSSAALVSIDDALKTSEQELGFAEAQFGKDATREFAEAITSGRASVKEAFGLRQKLDDAEPETESQQRQMNSEIIRLCMHVSETLDEHVDTFDKLRDLQAKAPQVLEEVDQRAGELIDRLPAARTIVTQLAASYPATSLASVDKNPDQAEALVTAAKEQVVLGKAALSSDDRATAVTHARAAEDAVGQASTLLDAVDDADANLKAAPAKIAERLSSLQLDVDDATRLAAGDPAIAAAASAAASAITYAQQPGHDPLAAEAGLETAEATLDDLLAPVRAAAAEAEKARVALSESLGRVTSRVKAVSDFIETRRGAVGAEARTRLSEAARHLDRAQQTLTTDPAASHDALQKAESFVDEAERRAQTDVGNWERTQRQTSGGAGGGLNSMVLGGILIDSIGRGGGSSGSRASVGGGRSPGSFGGGGTRGRRGGGGRF